MTWIKILLEIKPKKKTQKIGYDKMRGTSLKLSNQSSNPDINLWSYSFHKFLILLLKVSIWDRGDNVHPQPMYETQRGVGAMRDTDMKFIDCAALR